MYGPVPISRFLRSPSSSRTSRAKMMDTGSARFWGNMVLGVLRWMLHRVLVGRLDAFDLLEGEGLHAFLGVLLVAVFDVRGHQLTPVEGRDVVPLHALAELEGPHPEVRTALPGLREVALEGEIGGVRRLVG